jgi:hypothetical protein
MCPFSTTFLQPHGRIVAGLLRPYNKHPKMHGESVVCWPSRRISPHLQRVGECARGLFGGAASAFEGCAAQGAFVHEDCQHRKSTA